MLQKSPVVLIIAGDESEHVARALSDVFCAAFHISSPVVTFNLSSASVRSELHDRLDRGKRLFVTNLFLFLPIDSYVYVHVGPRKSQIVALKVLQTFVAVHSTFPLAVLNGVDHLGWDAPLVLHAFADDSSMAPPHTLLFLTIKKAFDSSKIDCEQSVME
ncbi:hypothetical protein Y032_0131g1602 [Ancylostoma ceylanicum]|uniref:Uncharacterized protein n=1 Tax=Ancylostoma ceylanicum TaxID=53326 RepID=A0A016T6Q1_9BILA|nr:hypothetical protein Y032_0131g1602 [Ancylostoma ceylanicum]